MQSEKSQELGFSAERLGRIEKTLSRYIEREQIAGIHAVVARHGKVAYSKCLGWGDKEAGRSIDEDTIYRIYSMTKPITSVAAMMLYETGGFRLDDPVSRYIPYFKDMGVLKNATEDGRIEIEPAASEILIWHLFTHTSGLSYGFDKNDSLDKLYGKRLRHSSGEAAGIGLERMVERLASLPLAHHPGTKWRYSTATDVLGYLVQVVSGRPFEEFLKERIFEPLGMPDTDFYVPESKRDRFATCYGPGENGGMRRISDDEGFRRYTEPVDWPSGGGGLVSTSRDYLRFAQMLLNGGELEGVRLLGRKTIELMAMDHMGGRIPPRDDPPRGFGLGFGVVTDLASTRILGSVGSYGWGGAANTDFWVDPVEDLIGLLMLQFMPGNTYPVIFDFRIGVYQALVD